MPFLKGGGAMGFDAYMAGLPYHGSEKGKPVIERFLSEISYSPELYGKQADIFVFDEDCINTHAFRVPIRSISVELRQDDKPETSVRFVSANTDSLVMRDAESAVILVPQQADLAPWKNFLVEKTEKYAQYEANRPRPGRKLPK